MKVFTTDFLAEIRASVTTLAFCWRLTLMDGRVLGFTNHSSSFNIEGVTYEAESGLLASAFSSSLALDPDDVQLESFFSSTQISETDLLAGRIDAAEYLYFMVSYQKLPDALLANPAQCLILSAGRLGGYSADERRFRVEALSLIDKLSEKQSIQTSPVCRATLGDSLCTVNLGPYTHDLTVTSAAQRRLLTVSLNKPDGYFKNGELRFLSSDNAPARVKIADWDNTTKQIRLFVPTFFSIPDGTQIRAIAGCRKTVSACKQFSNIHNFRGEPRLPGQDVWVSGAPVSGPDPDPEEEET